jgi:hypothetical protein
MDDLMETNDVACDSIQAARNRLTRTWCDRSHSRLGTPPRSIGIGLRRGRTEAVTSPFQRCLSGAARVPAFPHSNPAVVISRHLNAAPLAVSDLRPELAELDAVLSKALARGRTPPIAIRCAGFRPGPLPLESALSVLVIIGRIKAFRIHPLFGYTGVTDNPPGTRRADEALASAFHEEDVPCRWMSSRRTTRSSISVM